MWSLEDRAKPSAGAGVRGLAPGSLLCSLSIVYCACSVCMSLYLMLRAMYDAEGMQGGCQCDAQRAVRAMRTQCDGFRMLGVYVLISVVPLQGYASVPMVESTKRKNRGRKFSGLVGLIYGLRA